MPKPELYILGLSCILLFSCTDNSSLEDRDISEAERNDCFTVPDSLIRYVMEPLTENISDVSFIDIKTCEKFVLNDSLQLRIELRQVPDSILINNNNIPYGYFEYGLEFVFRNQNDTTRMDNIVFSLEYMRPESDSQEKWISIQEYLAHCNHKVYHELAEEGQEPTERKTDFIKIDYDINVDSNTIHLNYPSTDLCTYIDDYFSGGYYVKTSFNISNEPHSNNIRTGYLSSDGWVRHFYLFNSARKVSEN